MKNENNIKVQSEPARLSVVRVSSDASYSSVTHHLQISISTNPSDDQVLELVVLAGFRGQKTTIIGRKNVCFEYSGRCQSGPTTFFHYAQIIDVDVLIDSGD